MITLSPCSPLLRAGAGPSSKFEITLNTGVPAGYDGTSSLVSAYPLALEIIVTGATPAQAVLLHDNEDLEILAYAVELGDPSAPLSLDQVAALADASNHESLVLAGFEIGTVSATDLLSFVAGGGDLSGATDISVSDATLSQVRTIVDALEGSGTDLSYHFTDAENVSLTTGVHGVLSIDEFKTALGADNAPPYSNLKFQGSLEDLANLFTSPEVDVTKVDPPYSYDVTDDLSASDLTFTVAQARVLTMADNYGLNEGGFEAPTYALVDSASNIIDAAYDGFDDRALVYDATRVEATGGVLTLEDAERLMLVRDFDFGSSNFKIETDGSTLAASLNIDPPSEALEWALQYAASLTVDDVTALTIEQYEAITDVMTVRDNGDDLFEYGISDNAQLIAAEVEANNVQFLMDASGISSLNSLELSVSGAVTYSGISVTKPTFEIADDPDALFVSPQSAIFKEGIESLLENADAVTVTGDTDPNINLAQFLALAGKVGLANVEAPNADIFRPLVLGSALEFDLSVLADGQQLSISIDLASFGNSTQTVLINPTAEEISSGKVVVTREEIFTEFLTLADANDGVGDAMLAAILQGTPFSISATGGAVGTDVSVNYSLTNGLATSEGISFVKQVNTGEGVVATPGNLSDANDEGTMSVTVTFGEAMDETVAPTLTLSPDVSSSLTLDADNSEWTSSTEYVATYTVADDGVDENAVTVEVSGARDVAGNPMAAYTAEVEFSIDTLNPSVTGLTSDNADGVVSDGDREVTYTVTFSEAVQGLSAGDIAVTGGVVAKYPAKAVVLGALDELASTARRP